MRTVRASLALLVAGLAACGTTEEAKKPAPPPPPPVVEQVAEADPRALCAKRLEVDDAVSRVGAEGAAKSFAAARDANPDDRVAVYGALRAIENEKQRWGAFKALGDEHPDSAVAALGECEVYSWWKMEDQAAGPCADAAARLEGLALVEVARAELALRRSSLDAALAALDRADAIDGTCASTAVVRARVHAARDDATAALAAWDDAIARAPQCFLCVVAKAELVEKSGAARDALPLWERALELEPTHAATLERFAAALVGEDDAKALQAYERALAARPPTASTLFAAASLAARVDDLVKAADYAEKAAALDAEQIDVWRLLLEVATKRDEVAAKERAAAEIVRLVPADVEARLVLARIARDRAELVEALAHYDVVAGAADVEGTAAAKAEGVAERQKLKADLLIPDVGPTGDANRVVNAVQKTARTIYEQRLKQNRKLKGALDLVIRTRGDGAVEDVAITDDTLGDPHVAACVIGNLKAARVSGKAQRITVKLAFE